MIPTTANCHVCGGVRVRLLRESQSLPRVSSDCKPLAQRPLIGWCEDCSALVTDMSQEWRGLCDAVYSDYFAYRQSGGTEDRVFVPAGVAGSRSAQVMGVVRHQMSGVIGIWLDFGCGTGNFISEIPTWFPEAKLVGLEWDESGRERILGLPNVSRFVTSLAEVSDNSLDVLSMVHVLEHIEDPIALLASVFRVLRPGGYLLVQVPHVWSNPYALMIADHATHFDPHTLRAVITSSGLEVVTLMADAIPGELTVLARRPVDYSGTRSVSLSNATAQPRQHSLDDAAGLVHAIGETVDWMLETLSQSTSTAILGTSIAGTWSAVVADGDFWSWVDEDPLRQGGVWLDHPVQSVEALGEGTLVLVMLAPIKATSAMTRLRDGFPHVRFESPPALAAWWVREERRLAV